MKKKQFDPRSELLRRSPVHEEDIKKQIESLRQWLVMMQNIMGGSDKIGVCQNELKAHVYPHGFQRSNMTEFGWDDKESPEMFEFMGDKVSFSFTARAALYFLEKGEYEYGAFYDSRWRTFNTVTAENVYLLLSSPLLWRPVDIKKEQVVL